MGLAHDGLANEAEDQLLHAFGELEHDVTGEAVGDGHVAGAASNILALDVADEVEAARLKEWDGSLDESVAFGFFFAIADEADAGLLEPEDVTHIGVAKLGELEKVSGVAVGVGADVQEEDARVEQGQDAGDSGAVDVLDAAQREEGGRHDGAAVAGGEEGVGGLVFDEAHGDVDRGVALL